jgi:DNA-binding transcriptional ArsR family regulator
MSPNSFEVLSHPVRFRIVEILASGEHMSGEISDAVTGDYGIGRAAVSKHLAVLRESGWVDVLVEGPVRWYKLRDEWWRLVDRDLEWLKYLWKRRTGPLSKNDADPAWASTVDPFVPTPLDD